MRQIGAAQRRAFERGAVQVAARKIGAGQRQPGEVEAAQVDDAGLLLGAPCVPDSGAGAQETEKARGRAGYGSATVSLRPLSQWPHGP